MNVRRSRQLASQQHRRACDQEWWLKERLDQAGKASGDVDRWVFWVIVIGLGLFVLLGH